MLELNSNSGVEISDYSCVFFHFSFQFYQFLFMYCEAVFKYIHLIKLYLLDEVASLLLFNAYLCLC